MLMCNWQTHTVSHACLTDLYTGGRCCLSSQSQWPWYQNLKKKRKKHIILIKRRLNFLSGWFHRDFCSVSQTEEFLQWLQLTSLLIQHSDSLDSCILRLKGGERRWKYKKTMQNNSKACKSWQMTRKIHIETKFLGPSITNRTSCFTATHY